jgi:hypothetical protein
MPTDAPTVALLLNQEVLSHDLGMKQGTRAVVGGCPRCKELVE